MQELFITLYRKLHERVVESEGHAYCPIQREYISCVLRVDDIGRCLSELVGCLGELEQGLPVTLHQPIPSERDMENLISDLSRAAMSTVRVLQCSHYASPYLSSGSECNTLLFFFYL